ncbi:MAG: hypothetical protein AAF619_13130 [Pseudomonadota bacterium]
MTRFANARQIIRIPEQDGITTMRSDMMRYRFSTVRDQSTASGSLTDKSIALEDEAA